MRLDESYARGPEEDYNKTIADVNDEMLLGDEGMSISNTPADWQKALSMNYDDSAIYADAFDRQSVSGFLGDLDKKIKKNNVSELEPERRQIDWKTLNFKQRKAYDIVEYHFNNKRKNKKPLKLLITGSAGTRKSYVIDAIANLLKEGSHNSHNRSCFFQYFRSNSSFSTLIEC